MKIVKYSNNKQKPSKKNEKLKLIEVQMLTAALIKVGRDEQKETKVRTLE
jgi:hypothetical protein